MKEIKYILILALCSSFMLNAQEFAINDDGILLADNVPYSGEKSEYFVFTSSDMCSIRVKVSGSLINSIAR